MSFADPLSESRSDDIYVPRDEAFSWLKQASFGLNKLKALFNTLIPTLEGLLGKEEFSSFTTIDQLFKEGIELPNAGKQFYDTDTLLPEIVRAFKKIKRLLKFDAPQLFDSMALSFSS